MSNLVEVGNLGKDYGSLRAVSDVSFTVRKGEILGFLGPNGAGKSTTMKMLTGFLTPSRGTARVCGFDVRESPRQVKERIGYLPESSPSYGEMTVLEFLEFIAAVRGLPDGGRERIAKVTELCQLGRVLNQTIETLSKGFRQRVGFAQAILHDPPVLVLDEPTDGLDPNQKYEVRRIISGMASEKAIILSTHILEEVEALCTRIIIIAGGRLLVDETPASLLARHSGRRLDAVFRELTAVQAEPARAASVS
jgi:ABC-2 type transport system ATP-binding protein